MDLFSEAEEILISSSSREPLDRRAHVTTFASLLGAGRQSGNNETVLATKDSAELARFFSKRYLHDKDAMSIPPPSISSSSLLIHGKNGKDFTVNNSKGSLQQLAVLNMSSKFYTTPDSAFYTPKTILKNVMNCMEELMESRLKSTLLQLVQKSAERGVQRHMNLLFQLISPSKNPLHIATILTQFVSPEHVHCEDNVEDADNLVKLTLDFKANIDVVIFGDVKSVELRGPVSISAKFDPSDNLLSAIDIKFDCETLLMSMISNARMLVNTLIKKTAALSIGIAKYHEQQNASAVAVAQILAGKPPSVQSLGSVSLGSGSLCSNLSALFSSLSSYSGRGSAGCRQPGRSSQSSSRGLRRTSLHKTAELRRVNEEFELSRVKKSESVVRFKMPNPTQAARPRSMSPKTAKAKESGNIHQGLFHWIQDDEMFLTEDKIKEQNAINEEQERRAREAPMPLRFFTAAEEIGGGELGLEKVSDALFGGRKKEENNKKR